MTTLTNPPVPAGYNLLKQSELTPDLTAWAVSILHNPTAYPMFATSTRVSGQLDLLARVEWHPADFQNHTVHRGVTLYDRFHAPELYAEGIDVSRYQPVVDWAKAAQAGVRFAFIKATEGTTHLDNTFGAHWAGAKQARVLRGAYHFFRPQQDGASQARYFLRQLTDHGELPPMLDVEVADGVSPVALVTGIDAWLGVVTASLARPIIYTSPAFWKSLPSIASIASKADLCLAAWNVPAPGAVSGWSNWTFWQYTNKGSVAGIPGLVDRERFMGGVEQLQAYSDQVRTANAGLKAQAGSSKGLSGAA